MKTLFTMAACAAALALPALAVAQTMEPIANPPAKAHHMGMHHMGKHHMGMHHHGMGKHHHHHKMKGDGDKGGDMKPDAKGGDAKADKK